MENLKDWQIRSLKTFVETFFSILIPEFCAFINGGWPESWGIFWAALTPVICSALSMAITAAWNIVLEHLKS